MASFLFLAKSISNAGRIEGDPISIRDDSFQIVVPSGTWRWSAEEDIRRWIAEGNAENDFPDLFYVIDIIGMPLVSAQRMLQPWRRPAEPGDPEYDAADEPDRYVTLGPHRWQFGVADKLPGPLKTKLRNDRFLDLPYNATVINTYVTDRAGLDVLITDNPINP